ncbi:MAG: hypothetical protein ACI9Y1_001478 [Lentisphaeria bacterium]|jgi:hypothetical protein
MQWQKISKRILKRQIPHALLSWRYILPGQSIAVKLHRKIFLSAWPDQSRATWFLVALYSYTLWYLIYSWRHVFRDWKNYGNALKRQEGISNGHQLFSLLSLALLHSIPPRFYYHYRLYSYPREEWLKFIYTHELPHWHMVMSRSISETSKQLMVDKHLFSVHMRTLDLPTITTLDCLAPGQESGEMSVFNQRSVFLKPCKGSAKRGCYRLLYEDDTNDYSLITGNSKPIQGKETIASFLRAELQQYDYLVQPLLRNHEWLRAEGALITIRLVTLMRHGIPKSICATLEVPIHDDLQEVYLLVIDCNSGLIIDTPSALLKKRGITETLINKNIVNAHLPQWNKIKDIVEKAHSECIDITTIGWDLALTTDGIKLLEGNTNWGVYAHQRLDNKLIENFASML